MCGSVCNLAEETFVEPVEDLWKDAEGYVEENFVEPLEDLANETWDYITATAEDLWEDVEGFAERLEEIAENMADRIEQEWEDFKEKASDIVADLLDGLEAGWNNLINTLEDWGEWIKEQVDSAVEWLKNSAEAVFDWFVEDLIPWVVSLIKLPWVIAKLIGGLIALGICWITSKFTQPEEVKVIQAITEHHPRVLDDFRIARLPVEEKYVVFSDIHMFVKGDFDFYNNNRNSAIHQWLLAKYTNDGYHLIDNGDIEDFWMRGGSIRGHILDVADILPYPYFYNAYINQSASSALQLHAFNIFIDNPATYMAVNDGFVAQDRYTRTIGNHDDVWDNEDMLPVFDIVYDSPVVAHDYILLDNSQTNETEFVIAHGHQSDIWNMQLCDFAGKAVTEAFCALTELSVGLIGKIKKFYETRDKWESELQGNGFDNELHRMESLGFKQSLDEVELYEELEDIYGNSLRQPYLILGHTHHVKHNAGAPYTWYEYSNSGTTGMWEEIVFCLEINNRKVQPVAWYTDSTGAILRQELSAYRFGGDCFIK
jgi:hypothetical protein